MEEEYHRKRALQICLTLNNSNLHKASARKEDKTGQKASDRIQNLIRNELDVALERLMLSDDFWREVAASAVGNFQERAFSLESALLFQLAVVPEQCHITSSEVSKVPPNSLLPVDSQETYSGERADSVPDPSLWQRIGAVSNPSLPGNELPERSSIVPHIQKGRVSKPRNSRVVSAKSGGGRRGNAKLSKPKASLQSPPSATPSVVTAAGPSVTYPHDALNTASRKHWKRLSPIFRDG